MPWDTKEQTRAGMKITTIVEEAPTLVPLGTDRYLPDRYRVTADRPGWPLIHLTVKVEYGRPTCQELHLERRTGGEPITSTVMRDVPLATIVRESVAVAGLTELFPIKMDDPEWKDVPELELGSPELAKQLQDGMLEAYDARQGKAIGDDLLQQVADIYRQALAGRRPPTQAVARQLPISRSTAGRYVQRARARGFLGPTQERVAGEMTS